VARRASNEGAFDSSNSSSNSGGGGGGARLTRPLIQHVQDGDVDNDTDDMCVSSHLV